MSTNINDNLSSKSDLNSEFNFNYEIIDRSDPIPINYREIRLTWGKYFKKLYNISLIILISFVIYFYYIYGKNNTQDEIIIQVTKLS